MRSAFYEFLHAVRVGDYEKACSLGSREVIAETKNAGGCVHAFTSSLADVEERDLKRFREALGAVKIKTIRIQHNKAVLIYNGGAETSMMHEGGRWKVGPLDWFGQ